MPNVWNIKVDDNKFRQNNSNKMTRMDTAAPIFPNHGPREEDVVQSTSGSCYMLSVLRAMTAKNPDQIRQLFTDNSDGTVTVHFYETMQDGSKRPFDVVIDKSLPPQDNHSAPWVRLMEKAFVASGLMKKTVQNGITGYDANSIPDPAHPFMESLNWYDSNAFYNALIPENQRNRSDFNAEMFGSIPDAERAFVEMLRTAEQAGGIITISSPNHEMQYKRLETVNGTPQIVYFDQFSARGDQTVTVHDLFRNDTNFDAVRAVYNDGAGPVYFNISPVSVTREIERKERPLTEAQYLDQVYTFYNRELLKTVENHNLEQEGFAVGGEKLNHVLSYPRGKMDEALRPLMKQGVTAVSMETALFSDNEGDAEYRALLMNELKKFADANYSPDSQDIALNDLHYVVHQQDQPAAEENNEPPVNDQPLTKEIMREAVYAYYEAAIREAGEAAGLSQQQIQNASEYPKGKMNDLIDTITGLPATIMGMTRLLEEDTPERRRLMDQMLSLLKDFSRAEAERENAPEEAAVIGGLFQDVPENEQQAEEHADDQAEASKDEMVDCFNQIAGEVIHEEGLKAGLTEQEASYAMNYPRIFMTPESWAVNDLTATKGELREFLAGQTDDAKQMRVAVSDLVLRNVYRQAREGNPPEEFGIVTRALDGYLRENNVRLAPPLTDGDLRKMVYAFYAREIRRGAEASGLAEEEIERAAEYPAGKMNEQLNQLKLKGVSVEKLNQYLYGHTKEDQVQRDLMLKDLQQFVSAELRKRPVSEEARLFEKISILTEEERYAQADDSYNIEHHFEDLPFMREGMTDFAHGAAELLPSMQIFNSFEQAFRASKEADGIVFEDIAYHRETCIFSMYRNALNKASMQGGALSYPDGRTLDHLISLSTKAENEFGRYFDASADRSTLTGNALMYAKMAEVLRHDRQILRQMKKSWNKDHAAYSLEYRIVSAKAEISKEYAKTHPELSRQLPVREADPDYTSVENMFSFQKEQLAKQEANTWRRMNTIAAELDRFNPEGLPETKEFAELKKRIFTMTANRPKNYEEFYKAVHAIGKLADKCMKNMNAADQSEAVKLQRRILSVISRTASANERSMQNTIRAMRGKAYDQLREKMLKEERFASEKHLDVNQAEEERNRLEDELQQNGFDAEKFARFHVLDSLLSAGADAQIMRMTESELDLRSRECLHGSAMNMMTSALSSSKYTCEQLNDFYQTCVYHSRDIKTSGSAIPEILEQQMQTLKDQNAALPHSTGDADFDNALRNLKTDIIEKMIEEKKTERADHMKRIMAYNEADQTPVNAFARICAEFNKYTDSLSVRSDLDLKTAPAVFSICKLMHDGYSLKEIMMPGSLAKQKEAAVKESLEMLGMKKKNGAAELVFDHDKAADYAVYGMKKLRKQLVTLESNHDIGQPDFPDTPEGQETYFASAVLSGIIAECRKSELLKAAAEEKLNELTREKIEAHAQIVSDYLNAPDRISKILSPSYEKVIAKKDLISALTMGVSRRMLYIDQMHDHVLKAPSVENKQISERTVLFTNEMMTERWQANADVNRLADALYRNRDDYVLLYPYIADGSIGELFEAGDVNFEDRTFNVTHVPSISECRNWAKQKKISAYSEASASLKAVQKEAKKSGSTYASSYMSSSVKAMKKLCSSYAPPDVPVNGISRQEISSLMNTVLKGTYMADQAEAGISEKEALASFAQIEKTGSMKFAINFAGKSSLASFMKKEAQTVLLQNAERELEEAKHPEAVPEAVQNINQQAEHAAFEEAALA